MMIVENEFNICDVVYLKTDKEQCPRIISAIIVFNKGEIMYKLTSGTIQSDHYPFEMSAEINVLMTTTN